MKKIIFTIVFSIIAGISINASAGNVSVRIDPELKYQAVEGWGVSLCWWAHMIGQWEDEQKIDEIVDWLTAPDKLNMNIFRYNIGGGDDPSHYTTPDKPGHMVKGKGFRAEMQGFKPSEDAPYNWNADRGQRRIMLKIKEKRPDAIFEAFSNSPPYWMTYTGCSAGNVNGLDNNLKPEYYGAFCDYLIDVCKHYKEVYGIEFKTLEPFNEPQCDWYFEGSQEGCHFNIPSQIELVKVLYPKLQASGLNTVISASDETNLPHFTATLKAYMADSGVIDMIGQVNVHSYTGTDEERIEIEGLTKKIRKDFWQSETGNLNNSKGLVNNLELAQKCISDMKHMKPNAWLDWQFIEGGDTWCQINVDFGNKKETYKVVKNLYVRMQLSRFIKQGYHIIDTNDESTLAAINPEGTELVVCHINMSGKEQSVSYDLSLFGRTGHSATVFRTSDSENCNKLADITVSGNRLHFTCADNTVTTTILPVTTSY